jgi:uncharacterized membrane protein YhhN
MSRLAPIILIVLGGVFLLSNLGYAPIHQLRALAATWWPLILILVGVVMLFDRRGKR